MYHRESERLYHVVCTCGQTYPVANPDLLPIMTCGVCGNQIKVTDENVISPEDTTMALYQRLKEQPAVERIMEAVRLVKEGKHEIAKPLFRSVVLEAVPIREAFYGMGYCCYRDHEYLDALLYLGVAHLLGHPHAESLFKKIKNILNIADVNIQQM